MPASSGLSHAGGTSWIAQSGELAHRESSRGGFAVAERSLAASTSTGHPNHGVPPIFTMPWSALRNGGPSTNGSSSPEPFGSTTAHTAVVASATTKRIQLVISRVSLGRSRISCWPRSLSSRGPAACRRSAGGERTGSVGVAARWVHPTAPAGAPPGSTARASFSPAMLVARSSTGASTRAGPFRSARAAARGVSRPLPADLLTSFAGGSFWVS